MPDRESDQTNSVHRLNRKGAMTTHLYDGTSSPVALLANLASTLGIPVITMLAWVLALTMAIATIAFRRGQNAIRFASLLVTVIATIIAIPDLTGRGDDSWPYFALLSLLMTIVTLITSVLSFIMMLNWSYSSEAHPAPPMLLAGSLLTASIWATLTVTLLQNSMSSHWVGAMVWLHYGVLFCAATLPILTIVQLVYWRKRAKHSRKPSLWQSLRER